MLPRMSIFQVQKVALGTEFKLNCDDRSPVTGQRLFEPILKLNFEMVSSLYLVSIQSEGRPPSKLFLCAYRAH